LLKEIYHSYRILEEVKLPGSTASHRRSVLYLDFFIPNLRLGIEVHGQQHYEYSPFFHKNKAAFLKAQSRDEDKLKWCELNDIELVVLKYSDNEDDWRNTIKGV
jgi:very-short-patch-repair endonuclease